MKARPKHIACISVSSLYLSVQQHGLPAMDTEDLVAISQCRCTSGDLERMSGIIANKLGIQMNSQPVTALTFVRLFYNVFRNVAHLLEVNELYDKVISLEDLEMRLEILVCDANCSGIRASELALVLVCTHLDIHIKNIPGIAKDVNDRILQLVDTAIRLQKMCRVSIYLCIIL